MRPAPDLLARRLLFFTGKGGVGKSTVTAATALLAADRCQRVLVVEADAKGNLPGNFEQPSVGFEPREVYPGVCAMAMRTEDSLKEYLKLNLRVPVLGRLGPLARVLDFVATAAPGVKEILTVGKVCWEVRESIEGRADWDLVVVDAAATGHIIGQLDAPRAIQELVSVGMVREQTDWMVQLLSNPSVTALNVVATPEEMPVNETIDFITALDDEMGLRPDAVVVNGVYPERFRGGEMAAIDELGADSPQLRAAITSYRRARHHRNQVRRLRRRAPAITLPFLFETELDDGSLDSLADVLEQRLG
jgi:anion-transporting  ArsA/GET3 family ATPase